MKKLAIILGLVALVFGFAYSCNHGSSSGTPEDTVKTYYTALIANDIETVTACVYPDPTQRAQFIALVTNDGQEEFVSGVASYAILSSGYDEDGNAEVVVHVVYKDATEKDKTHKLYKQDGVWYIDANTK